MDNSQQEQFSHVQQPNDKKIVEPHVRSNSYLILIGILLFIIGIFVGSSLSRSSMNVNNLVAMFITPTPTPTIVARPTPINSVNQSDLVTFKNTAALLTPTGGETLCLGKTYNITWRVPADDTEGITLKIALPEDGDSIHELGSFPGTYNSKTPGNGTFTWIVGQTTDNATLKPGPAYHIFLQGDYKGWGLNTASSPLFVIANCSQNH